MDDKNHACEDFRLADYGDWRLPTIDELKTLMIEGKAGYNSPAGVFFKPIIGRWGECWSASPCAFAGGFALVVDFDLGYSDYDLKYDYAFVRAVRDGQ